METKRCRSCGEVKPLTEFHHRGSAGDGRASNCKVCSNTYGRSRRAARGTTSAPGVPKPGESLGDKRPDLAPYFCPSNTYGMDRIPFGSSYKIQWACAQCDRRWVSSANKEGSRKWRECPCENSRRKTIELTDGQVRWWGEGYPYTEAKVRTSSSFKWRCPSCETSFRSTVRNFKPVCFCGYGGEGKLIRVRHGEGRSRVVSVSGRLLKDVRPECEAEYSSSNGIPFSALSHNSGGEVVWECGRGHRWVAPVYQRVNSETNCPQCSGGGTSRGEKELREFVASLLGGVRVEGNVRGLVEGYEADVWIPSMRTAIEYNGLYWHSDLRNGDKNYHKNKWGAFQRAGITLIMVWEDDWVHRNSIVKAMVAHKLGASGRDVVYARKTSVVALGAPTAREFCDDNHIQGFVPGSLYLGLVNEEGELVAAAVWRKHGG